MARSKGTVKGARSWLGTLLVAWTFVSGGALVIATAYYQRSGDIRFLITWLAPPFLIGTVLMGSIALVAMFGGVKEREVEVVNHTGTRQSIFRER
jgi:hypothetical protein